MSANIDLHIEEKGSWLFALLSFVAEIKVINCVFALECTVNTGNHCVIRFESSVTIDFKKHVFSVVFHFNSVDG